MLVCPPKSHTWNLILLYVTVSTLKPMAAAGQQHGSVCRHICQIPLIVTEAKGERRQFPAWNNGVAHLGWWRPLSNLQSVCAKSTGDVRCSSSVYCCCSHDN